MVSFFSLGLIILLAIIVTCWLLKSCSPKNEGPTAAAPPPQAQLQPVYMTQAPSGATPVPSITMYPYAANQQPQVYAQPQATAVPVGQYQQRQDDIPVAAVVT